METFPLAFLPFNVSAQTAPHSSIRHSSPAQNLFMESPPSHIQAFLQAIILRAFAFVTFFLFDEEVQPQKASRPPAAGFFFCAFYERAEAIHWQRVEKGWKEAGNSVIIAS